MITKQEDFIRKMIREELSKFSYGKENVAGDKVIPNKLIYHVSNPKYRKEILNSGLIPKSGDSYAGHAGYEETIIPAIFATNSENENYWFDSTYDDDVWEIDTTNLKNEWFIDKHYGGDEDYPHIVTFEPIPINNLKLIYKGTGESK